MWGGSAPEQDKGGAPKAPDTVEKRTERLEGDGGHRILMQNAPFWLQDYSHI